MTGKNLIDEKNIYKTNLNWFIENKSRGGKGFNLKKGIPYTVSIDDMVSGLYFNDYDTDETIIKVYGEQQLTYTPADDTRVTLLIFAHSGIKDDMKVQLEVGSTATTYESYREPQNLVLTIPNGLMRLNVDSGGNYTDSSGQQWICDRIVEKDGVIGIERNIKSVRARDLTWDADFYTNNGKYIYRFSSINNDSKIRGAMLSNRLIYNVSGVKDYGQISCEEPTKIRVAIGDTYNTIDLFNKFILENEIIISYQLATSTFEPLPQAEQEKIKALHTNYPTTVISNDESAHMEVFYVADTKNYFDKKFEVVSKALANTNIQLLREI